VRALSHDVLLHRFDANQPDKATCAIHTGRKHAKWAPSSAHFRAQNGAIVLTRINPADLLAPRSGALTR
jgi:hypothetical protein